MKPSLKPSIPVPPEYAHFARAYLWGYEDGLLGKPIPEPRMFSFAESYRAYCAGHAAGVLANPVSTVEIVAP